MSPDQVGHLDLGRSPAPGNATLPQLIERVWLGAPKRLRRPIVGRGGMGETSVVLAVAEALLAAYDHGIRLIELSLLADPRLAPHETRLPTVAASLQLTRFSSPTEPGEIGVAWSGTSLRRQQVAQSAPEGSYCQTGVEPALAEEYRERGQSTVGAQSEGAPHGSGRELEGRIPRACIPQRH
jgi:hypothetical protein